MDIALKYKIISKIINSEDGQVLQSIQSLLNIEDEKDFWDEMSTEDQAAVNEGLEQLDNGQYLNRNAVKAEIKERFNF